MSAADASASDNTMASKWILSGVVAAIVGVVAAVSGIGLVLLLVAVVAAVGAFWLLDSLMTPSPDRSLGLAPGAAAVAWGTDVAGG